MGPAAARREAPCSSAVRASPRPSGAGVVTVHKAGGAEGTGPDVGDAWRLWLRLPKW